MGGNEILNRVSLDKIKKYYYLEGKGENVYGGTQHVSGQQRGDV